MIDDVIVVGGGIGGLGTALALAQTGVSVRVLERAAIFAEVGAGLQVGPNAVRALDRLGLLHKIRELAVFPEFGRIHDAVTGNELTRVPLQAPMIERFNYPYVVMHRNDVLTTLLDACRAHDLISLENDQTVESVVQFDDHVRIACSDGRAYSARLVVGADGLNSRVRRLIRDDEPIYSGYTAYRGTVPIDLIAPESRVDDVLLWIGPGIHLMQYPVRRGELYNQVAVYQGPPPKEAGETGIGTLRERFASACSSVGSAVQMLEGARAYPNYDKEPLSTFVTSRAVLVGDAAHPMLQYLGQGACQAL